MSLMTLRCFVIGFCAVAIQVVDLKADEEQRTRRPNIIYINADDLGVMDVGYNNPKYKTPNIDQLCSEGMRFTNAYAPAANCAPSRACVMSGQYSPRHGVYTVNNSDRGKAATRKLIPIKNTKQLDPQMLTLPAALKQEGYKTIHLGKWHLGDDPTKQGFDLNIGGSAAGNPGRRYFMPVEKLALKKLNGQYPKDTHIADVFSDQASRFIRNQKDAQEPFFLHMAYYLIHTPLQPVPEFVDQYKQRGKKRAAYASMIEKMDESVGKILAELDASGQCDNTLVVFTSDNGALAAVSPQKPFRSGKGSYFEGGIREPLVIRWPGHVQEGTTCDVPVSGIDFFPTFLDAASIQAPENKVLDGVSLLPLLTQNGDLPDRALYWHFPVYLQSYAGAADDSHDSLFRTRPGTAMRSGKWKFHEYFEEGRIELYDLETDPGERVNVAAQYPKKARQLHQMMKSWRAEINAPVPSQKNPKYKPALAIESNEKNRKKNRKPSPSKTGMGV